MANNVQFQDFSLSVLDAMDEETIAWLHEWAQSIQGQARHLCKMAEGGDREGEALRKSYVAKFADDDGEARIGSPRESVYWEEFGTGAYADKSKNGGKSGRPGWWVYVKNGESRSKTSATYSSREEAEAVAQSMQAENIDAYATNGREPSYTLENAFKQNKAKVERRLAQLLGEGMNE
jgi:hypothetical protein